MYMVF